MGHKMLSWYPWVPIGGLMGINCAFLTYNGTAYFGFTGDVHAAPGLEKLEKFVDQSFAELRAAAASVKPQGKKRERPNAKIALAKKRVVRKKSPRVSAPKVAEPAPISESTPEAEHALKVGT